MTVSLVSAGNMDDINCGDCVLDVANSPPFDYPPDFYMGYFDPMPNGMKDDFTSFQINTLPSCTSVEEDSFIVLQYIAHSYLHADGNGDFFGETPNRDVDLVERYRGRTFYKQIIDDVPEDAFPLDIFYPQGFSYPSSPDCIPNNLLQIIDSYGMGLVVGFYVYVTDSDLERVNPIKIGRSFGDEDMHNDFGSGNNDEWSSANQEAVVKLLTKYAVFEVSDYATGGFSEDDLIIGSIYSDFFAHSYNGYGANNAPVSYRFVGGEEGDNNEQIEPLPSSITEPGVYFVMIGISGAFDDQWATDMASLDIYSSTEFEITNLDDALPYYNPKNKMLDYDELHQFFEDNETLCSIMGGEYNADIEGPVKCCHQYYYDMQEHSGVELENSGAGYFIGEDFCRIEYGTWNAEGECPFCGIDGVVDASDDICLASEDVTGDFNSVDGSDGCCGDDPGDLGYVSESGRNFCSKDYIKGDPNYLAAANSTDTLWRWWDAKSYDAAFTIHTLDGIDYVSNAESWYYCAAGGVPTISSLSANALPIQEGDPFPSATADGRFRCVDTLNQLAGFFAEYDEAFEGFKDCEEGEITWCCQGLVEGELAGYTQGQFESSCQDLCYIDQGRLGNLLGTESGFEDAFCVQNPHDNMCLNVDIDDVLNFLEPSSDDQVPKSNCGFDLLGCLREGLSSNTPCEQVGDQPGTFMYQGNEYEGFACDDGEPGLSHYCASSIYLKTVDSTGEDSSIDTCCLIEKAWNYDTEDACVSFEDIVMTPQICENSGGDYNSNYEDASSFQICSSGKEREGCCLGGDWVYDWGDMDQLTYNSLTQNEAFICYQQNGQQRIAECCSDFSPCNNHDYNSVDIIPDSMSLFDSEVNNDYGYYGVGGSLHTLQNYDKFMTVGDTYKLVDLVRVVSGVDENNPFTETLYDSKISKLRDWSRAERLEFDMAFNVGGIDRIELVSFDGNTRHECPLGPFDSFLINGNKTMRWHRVVVPLADCHNDGAFDSRNIIEYRIVPKPRESMSIVADNFRLVDDDEENTPNYYCTGNFGSWIENLDGETDEGFYDVAYAELDFVEFGPHQYACEAQASFAWTGKLCCGDDTTVPYFAGGTQGREYFADEEAGCFAGAPVLNNMRVGDALNDVGHNGLLFYEGEFLVCEGSETMYEGISISFDGTPTTDALIAESNIQAAYSLRGKYMCGPDGKWLSVDEISHTKLLAAKLYDLSFEDENEQYTEFDLFCESFDVGSPYKNARIEATDLVDIKDEIEDFCTLRYIDRGNEIVITGFTLKGPAEEFLDYFTNHLSLIYPDSDPATLRSYCQTVTADARTNEEFFPVCEGNVNNLRMAYNREFDILFIADLDNYHMAARGMFRDSGNIRAFTEAMLTRFIDLFRGWFGGGRSAGGETAWTASTYLPVFSADGADFDKVYVGRRGDKTIQALANTHEHTRTDRYYTINYSGFNTEVESIAYRYYDRLGYPYQEWFEEGPIGRFHLGYQKGNDYQIISLQNPQLSTYDFEPAFDWRTLTTILNVNSQDYGEGMTSSYGNNILDANELCDTVNGQMTWRFNRGNNCSAWNSSMYNTQTVSCSNGLIDFTGCEYCGDGTINGEESCDPPGSAIAGGGICGPDCGSVGAKNCYTCDDNTGELLSETRLENQDCTFGYKTSATTPSCVACATCNYAGELITAYHLNACETGFEPSQAGQSCVTCGECDDEGTWTQTGSYLDTCPTGEVQETNCEAGGDEEFTACGWAQGHPETCIPRTLFEDGQEREDGCEGGLPYCEERMVGGTELFCLGHQLDYCLMETTQEDCEAKAPYCEPAQ